MDRGVRAPLFEFLDELLVCKCNFHKVIISGLLTRDGVEPIYEHRYKCECGK